MSNDLIPIDAVKEIIRQVFKGLNEAIANQTELSKQQLVQMMLSHVEKAYQEFVDTTIQKIDEFMPKDE